MDRTELLNAMRLLKDHCRGKQCCNCEIEIECRNEGIIPSLWDLEDGEPVEQV